MAGRSWLIDSNRIATKIKNASIYSNPQKVEWKSNPTKHCPNCHHIIDNSDVVDDWPGLPRGVKFDPSEQEIIWHLQAKVGLSGLKPHPFIDEFIPTVHEDDGICYTHPKNLPGVKQDGSMSHFFHRSIKAYNTGNRKRRKIHDDDIGDVRWHKTGKTKPVMIDGVQRGCKKIMVLYGGKKSGKTNWVMHQYHLGIEEDEKDGEFVVSKIFYQQQQSQPQTQTQKEAVKQIAIAEQEMPDDIVTMTPKVVTPELRYIEKDCSKFHFENESLNSTAVPRAQTAETGDYMNNEVQPNCPEDESESKHQMNDANEIESESVSKQQEYQMNDANDHTDKAEEDPKWWDSNSQYILDSQQLVEALSLCDDLLQSQSPKKDDGNAKNKTRLSDYAQLGTDEFKRDLEECQNLAFDPSNLELDTPPEFRLSQIVLTLFSVFDRGGQSGFRDGFLGFGFLGL